MHGVADMKRKCETRKSTRTTPLICFVNDSIPLSKFKNSSFRNQENQM